MAVVIDATGATPTLIYPFQPVLDAQRAAALATAQANAAAESAATSQATAGASASAAGASATAAAASATAASSSATTASGSAGAASGSATAAAGSAGAASGSATAASGSATAASSSATAAAGSAGAAGVSAAQAASAAATIAGIYPNAYASVLPQGVTGATITAAGSGGTAGTYALGISGGPTGFTGTYTIAGGAVTAIAITNPGLSTGSAAPAISFPSGGVTGATATAAVGSLIANQKTYWVISSVGTQLLLYGNNGGSVASAPFGGTQAALALGGMQFISNSTYLWAITDGSPNGYITIGCLAANGQLVFPSLPSSLIVPSQRFLLQTDPRYVLKITAPDSSGNEWVVLGVDNNGIIQANFPPAIANAATVAAQAMTIAQGAQAAIGSGRASRIKAIARRYAQDNPIDVPDGGATLAVLGSCTTSALPTTLSKTWSMTDSVQGNLFAFTNGVKVRYTSQYLTCWSVVSKTARNGMLGLGTAAPPFGTLNNNETTKIDFMFDGPLIAIQYGASFNGTVLIDGQFVQRSNFGSSSGSSGWITIQIPNWTRKLRRITIIYYLGNSSVLDNVLTAVNDTIAPAPANNVLRIGAFGDSITEGTGSSTRWGSWAQQLAMRIGGIQCDFRQMGIGGTGYENDATINTPAGNPQQYTFIQHVQDATQTDFDLITVAGGINDLDDANFQPAVLAFLQALRTNAPNAVIAVLGCWSGDAAPSQAVIDKEAGVAAAFAQWGDGNSVYIPISNDPSGSWVTAANALIVQDNNTDAIHPGDYGHSYYQRRAYAALLTKLGV